MVRLKIVGITFSQVQAGAYALILAEEGGNRRIPIIIGTPEAQSIAIFLEGLDPPRPLTHDLFMDFAKKLNVKLKQVNINQYQDGIFCSEVIFDTGERSFRMDARTSDAIALAVRVEAPIYISEEIMREIGILMEEEDAVWDDMEELQGKVPPSAESMTVEELQIRLNEAIRNEEFEKASSLRDLINQKISK